MHGIREEEESWNRVALFSDVCRKAIRLASPRMAGLEDVATRAKILSTSFRRYSRIRRGMPSEDKESSVPVSQSGSPVG